MLAAGIMAAFVATIVGLFVYFIPSFIAFSRLHPNRTLILILNIFAGWTLLGWVGALIWSLVTPDGAAFDPLSSMTDSKICPRCAERVKRAAIVCRFCGYEFGPPAPPPLR